jgi:hypothetical protein
MIAAMHPDFTVRRTAGWPDSHHSCVLSCTLVYPEFPDHGLTCRAVMS